ncbi:TetR/AcrR family transcriptional regulator [Rhodococcus sp. NPDC057529]|uniref:TetR/AcrR family transcriptional regulator n=1 Tax=Rhodococcus sp. NPDC057529 TaxID=3346158 RepID=UPI00366B58B6
MTTAPTTRRAIGTPPVAYRTERPRLVKTATTTAESADARATERVARRITRVSSVTSADITRMAILHQAASSFGQHGYCGSDLSHLTHDTQLAEGTGGSRSKSDLARAVIDEGFVRLAVAGARLVNRRTPALESLIDVAHLMVDPSQHDPLVGAAHRLLREVGDQLGSTPAVFDSWRTNYRNLLHRGIAEEDVRPDIDTDETAQLLLYLIYGGYLVSAATSHPSELKRQLTLTWKTLLPMIVIDAQQEYFREFTARRLTAIGSRSNTPTGTRQGKRTGASSGPT